MSFIRTTMLAAVLLAGCGSASATTDPNTTPTNTNGTNTTTTTNTPTQTSGATGFRIENRTSDTICYAYVSPVSDPNWGEDRLGSDVIAAGTAYEWAIDPGNWDVKLEDCNHQAVLERRNLTVTSGQMNVLSVP